MGLSIAPDPNVMLAHRFTFSTVFVLILMLMDRGKLSFKGKTGSRSWSMPDTVIIMTVSGMELGVVTPLGVLFLLLTLLSSALYKTANRRVADEFTPFERTFMVLAISAVAFTVSGMGAVGWDLSAFTAPLFDVRYLVFVLGLSLFCSIIANLLVNYALGNMSVFKVSSLGSLSTLCSTIAGVVFLKEPISVSLLLGAVLILVGIRQVTRQK